MKQQSGQTARGAGDEAASRDPTFDSSDPSMVHAQQRLEAEQRNFDQIVKEVGVPQHIYLRYIKSELDNERHCLELPVTIMILLSFSLAAIYMLRQQKIYAVASALEFDITENANFAWAHNFGHKGINDVNSIADFWSWMRLGYLPLVVQPTWAYSEAYPEALGSPVTEGSNYSAAALPQHWRFEGYSGDAPMKSDYLRYNRIIGGIRMRQQVAERTSPSLCRFPTTIDRKQLEAWLGKPCAPSDAGHLTPELRDSMVFEKFTRTQWLLPEIDSMDELTRVLIDMEDGCNHAASLGPDLSSCRCAWCRQQPVRQPWLDERTTRLEVAFIVYNPQYGMYSYLGVNLFFNRGGHIHKAINSFSVWSDLWGQSLMDKLVGYLAAIFWLGSLCYVFVSETWEIIGVVRGSEERCWTSIKEDYLNPWNIIDWISICIGVVAVFLFIRMRLAVGAVDGSLADMIQASISLTGQRDTYQAATESFFGKVESMVNMEKSFRTCLCIYPNTMMLRLFKSFAAQPRLAIVTETLRRAAVDLMHFGVVFSAVFLCMMVNSILFFGQDLEAFANVPRALHQCFRALFGDWDWGSLKEIGFFKAQIWFWVFVLINILILMNMLLAIIMDAYTAEKVKAGSAEPLWTQTWQMRRRRLEYKRNERVRLNDIWDVFLEEAKGDEKNMLRKKRLVSPEFLITHVPRMQLNQANRLLCKSLEHNRKLQDASITEEDTQEELKVKLEKVDRRAKQIAKDVKTVARAVNHYDCLEVHGDPEFEFYFGADGPGPDKSRESVEHAVTALSAEIGHLLNGHMSKLEGWQDAFEKKQNDLHAVITEMQSMVTQQADCFAGMSETLELLGNVYSSGQEAQ